MSGDQSSVATAAFTLLTALIIKLKLKGVLLESEMAELLDLTLLALEQTADAKGTEEARAELDAARVILEAAFAPPKGQKPPR